MTIVGILIKASVLLAAAVLAQSLLRKRLSATSRHLLWTLAIVGLLMLPVLSGLLPAWTVATVAPPGAVEAAPTAESSIIRPASEAPSSAVAPAATFGDTQPASIQMPWPTFATVLYALYAIGVVVFMVRLAAQQWSVRRLLRRATRVDNPVWTGLLDETARSLRCHRSIVLLRGLEEAMPMVCGTRRPAILLPAVADTWSEHRRRSVLLHELAHVARYDCLTQLLGAIACAIAPGDGSAGAGGHDGRSTVDRRKNAGAAGQRAKPADTGTSPSRSRNSDCDSAERSRRGRGVWSGRSVGI